MRETRTTDLGFSLARWVYRRMLKLYPNRFRSRYGEEMVRIFDGQWERVQSGGAWCRVRFLAAIVWETIISLGGEYWATARTSERVFLCYGCICIAFFAIDAARDGQLVGTLLCCLAVGAVPALRIAAHRRLYRVFVWLLLADWGGLVHFAFRTFHLAQGLGFRNAFGAIVHSMLFVVWPTLIANEITKNMPRTSGRVPGRWIDLAELIAFSLATFWALRWAGVDRDVLNRVANSAMLGAFALKFLVSIRDREVVSPPVATGRDKNVLST